MGTGTIYFINLCYNIFMPRTIRIDAGNEIHHVINRSNGRNTIFENKKEYELFEELLLIAQELFETRILAYTIMPNHFHLLLHPRQNGELGKFMHWLTTTHTRKYHTQTKTIGGGHLYQGRYKSFIVDKDEYLVTVIKYIERNPVRAKLVKKCEDWQWGSAYRRIHGTIKQKKLLAEIPTTLPADYMKWINTQDKPVDVTIIRNSVNRGVPYGGQTWKEKMIKDFNLESTVRLPGRPRKE